jgi:release factor glutamine methyltransferase
VTGAAASARLDALLREATDRLARAGVASPRGDAEHLAAHVLGVTPGEIAAAAVIGRPVTEDQAERFADLLAHRADRVPLQHLTGRAAFRRLELDVGPGVFVPRPETEVVAGLAIDAALALPAPLVVDLCTGSAAIALSVAVEVPAARFVALELEPQALAWAARNVDRVAPGRVELRAGDVEGCAAGVLGDLAGAVDVVVANPPYIPGWAVPLDPEVAEHDPHPALYGGGPDGLRLPSAVVRAAAVLLRPGGLLVMEHGDAQGAATRALAGDGWSPVRTALDLTGRDRALVARRADDDRADDDRAVDGRAVADRPGQKVRDFPS